MIVVNDGAQLFCRVMGSGSPIIVVHGGPGLTHDYLLPQLSELAKEHLVIFYDQRGCGASISAIDADHINVDAFISDLEAVRRHFGFQKITLLGHSWGGFLAMKYAIFHPKSVDRLILANSMSGSSSEFELFFKECAKRMLPYQTKIQKILDSKEFAEKDPNTVEKYYKIIFSTYCHEAKSIDSLNLKMSSTAAINGSKVYDILRASVFLKPYNLHPQLQKLNISTLIIHGDSDPIPCFSAESLHQSIKGSKYVLIKNCGHFPYVEDAQAFFGAINKFLHDSERKK